ncbi:MAG: DUF4347 domain-containing protein, partial [Microcoleaceae cyanobacterium]
MLLTQAQSILSAVNSTQQILFIDAQVPHCQDLIAGALPGIKVFLLNAQQDGVQQITEALNHYSNSYSNFHTSYTVHIVSHGSPGCLSLGDTQLSLGTLAHYAEQLQSWFSRVPLVQGDSGRSRPTLLLYGCHVAVGDAGAEFIENLQRLTGAEIAASTSLTGHADKGGNWNLDVRTREFVVPEVFSPATQQNWQGVLIDITGQAFLDFNNDGAISPADATVAIDAESDVGVGNITVTAFGSDGTLIATTTTAANGTYTLTVPDNTPVRLEFTGISDRLFNTSLVTPPASADTVSNVAFVDGGVANVTANLALYRPTDFTNRTTPPKLVATCYVFSDNTVITDEAEPAIIDLNYIAAQTGNPPNPVNPPGKTTLVTIGQVGATHGLTYHSEAADLFAAAFQKRHADIGPQGNDAIYRVDTNNANAVTPFINLDDFFGVDSAGPYSHGAAGQNPGDVGINFLSDERAFATVGKVALGDVEVSEDRQFIWTVNLNDRRLYKIPVGTAADPTTPVDYVPGDPRFTDGSLEAFDLISGLPGSIGGIDFTGSAVADDVRPFALAVRDGLVYIGFVDSAESTQAVGDLDASIYTFDPTTETFSAAPVIQFDLDYARQRKAGFLPAGTGTAEWDPWSDNFPENVGDFVEQGGKRWVEITQPILSDIAFDGNGDMILGFRDRTADQIGPNTPDLTGIRPTTNGYEAASGGDILRAASNGNGTWTIEDLTTPPTPREFYNQENLGTSHAETAQGGLAQVPGYSSIVTTALDPLRVNSGGFIQLSNTNGSRARSVEIFAGPAGGSVGGGIVFNKANGLGDLEYVSQLPQTTVFGDRIWIDIDADGIQDAGEPGIPNGVTVELYEVGGVTPVAITTTTNGEFLLSVPTAAFNPNTGYEIRLVATDFGAGALLENYVLSPADAPTGVAPGTSDTIDSDAVLVGAIPVITFTSGDFGQNNYNLDIGLFRNDYGDAPSSTTYLTLQADGGPSHQIISNLFLGTVAPDRDANGYVDGTDNNLDATDDDVTGTPDDEEAIDPATIPALSTGTTTYTLTIPVTNGTLETATVVGWIDFDVDGVFDADEGTTATVVSTGTTATLTWNNIGTTGPDIAAGTSYARFRISTDADLSDGTAFGVGTPGGAVDDGEVEDFEVTIAGLDFGDAPSAFGTLLANDGPRHTIVAGLQIGPTAPDLDTNGFGDGIEDAANPGTEDDTKGTAPDDEDAFTTLPALAVGSATYTLSVPVTNTLGSAANLVGWIDFNNNNTFEIGEAATVAVPDGTNGTTVNLTWSTIPTLTVGTTFARLRLSTDTILPPIGVATDGEVEDYPLSIVQPLDFGDAPTTYGTLLADSGPNHGIVSGLQIGPAAPDADTDGFGDGTPDLAAPGTEDDTNGINDENTFPPLPALTVGDTTYTLTVPVTNTVGAANLVGWIDFNQNGTFEATEGVTATVAANATTAALTWSAANSDLENVVAGTTYVRLRLSTDALTTANFGGTATNGEVEDYQLTVNPATPLDFGDAPATFGTPSHGIDPNIGLGAAVIDAEPASQPTPGADGDDLAGTTPDDEDAFTTLPTLATNATSYSVTVPVENTTGSPATLRGWIDFDGDGVFQADEAVSAIVANNATTATLTWDATTAPGFTGITFGASFARFRVSTDPLLTATNAVADGEVEDYSLAIIAPPTVDLDGDTTGTDFTTAFNGTPVAIGNNVVVADPDSPNISQAVITLTNPQDGAAEILNIDPANVPAGITVTGNGTTTITLTGDVPPATYQAAIQAITYNNTAPTPNPVPRTVTVQVTDPDNLTSNLAQTTITLAPTDFGDAPATFGIPSHGIDPNIGLGAAVIDAEPASQPTPGADGDDTTGTDDEDAFTTLPTLATNATNYSVTVPVENTTGNPATLVGWIDFDGDGVFQADEAVSAIVANNATTATLTWDATTAPGFTGITFG